jgi:ATP-dependent Clp protease ATP-binding subunit ClpB
MDANKLTVKSQEALQAAQSLAVERGHQEVDGEHLLMALLSQEDGLVARLIEAAGANAGTLEAMVEAELNRRPKVSGPGARPGEVYLTQRLSRMFDAAEREAKRLKDDYVSVEHLVLAMIEEGGSTAAGRLLQQAGLTRENSSRR